MADNIRVLITEEELDKRIRELGAQISADYEGEEVHLIGILKGSVFFMCELAKRITVPVTMDFMKVTSYGDGKVSSGVVRITKDTDEAIAGKNVIIVEDIVDTGNTLSYLKEFLRARDPKTLRISTLLDKPARRLKPVEAEYSGFVIDDLFVVGYGLDYAQNYRNLPFIGEIVETGGEA